MGRIVSIGTAVPEHKYKQQDILEYMLGKMDAHQVKQRRILSQLFKKSAIDFRYSVLPDFGGKREVARLYKSESQDLPNVDARMKVYAEDALLLLSQAVSRALEGIDRSQITHLITVSCTGLMAPGLDVLLVEALGLPQNIERSSVNFMGCHGGFHAMRQAHHICGYHPEAQVLIADVELSTLHFQKNTTTDEMLSNTLFADGAAAMLISGKNGDHSSCIETSNFHSQLILEGKSAMSWEISTHGFVMSLSSRVPNIISQQFEGLMSKIIASELPSLDKEDLLWAFHPGGVKILDVIQAAAGLSSEQMKSSYQVLRNYGNMSSCTIFFVLDLLLPEMKKTNKPLIAAGFGPGLSTEVMILNTMA